MIPGIIAQRRPVADLPGSSQVWSWEGASIYTRPPADEAPFTWVGAAVYERSES